MILCSLKGRRQNKTEENKEARIRGGGERRGEELDKEREGGERPFPSKFDVWKYQGS